MEVLIKNIKSFGTYNCMGVHQIVESERDIENATHAADRDNFNRIVFYFSYPSNWMTNSDFRNLVREAQLVGERAMEAK